MFLEEIPHENLKFNNKQMPKFQVDEMVVDKPSVDKQGYYPINTAQPVHSNMNLVCKLEWSGTFRQLSIWYHPELAYNPDGANWVL